MNQRFPVIVGTVLGWCCLVLPLSAAGQTTSWNTTAGFPNNIWSDGANWSNGVPIYSTHAEIGNGGTAVILNREEVNRLDLGGNTQSGHLLLDSFGPLSQLAVNQLYIGFGTAGGSVSLFRGSRIDTVINSDNGFIVVGGNGNGQLTLNGGSEVSSYALYVGSLYSSAGEVQVLSGSRYYSNGAALRVQVGSTSTPGTGSILVSGANSGFECRGIDVNRGSVTVADGATLRTTNGQNILIGSNAELEIGTGGDVGNLDSPVPIMLGGTLRFNHSGSHVFTNAIQGSGMIVNDAGSTTLSTATIGAFHGSLVSNGGTLRLNGSAPVTSIRSNDAGAVRYEGFSMNGGFLRGNGTHELAAGFSNSFNGTTTFASTRIEQNGTATLTNFSNGGLLTNSNLLTLDGFVNTSSGVVHVNHQVEASDFSTNGILNVNAGGSIQNSVGSLVAGGGSRTSINNGGQVSLLNNTEFNLNGGLLVNNGAIDGTLNVNYGSLAKGAGSFGTVNVTDGGTFSPGNSPGSVTVHSLVLDEGSELIFEIRDMQGLAGVDFDQILATDSIFLNGGLTDNSMLTISIVSLDSNNNPGLATNFDPEALYAFDFLAANQGIYGFDANSIRLDTSGFLNDPNSNLFQITSNGRTLSLNYSAVPEPAALSLLLIVGCASMMTRRRKSPRQDQPATNRQNSPRSKGPWL